MTPDARVRALWPSSGLADLQISDRGWLEPTGPWLARVLERPELAPVPESCTAEIALHETLTAQPLREVAATELAAIQDENGRDNYIAFLRFRDGLMAAGSLEAWYLKQVRNGVTAPPVLLDHVVAAIVHGLVRDEEDAIVCRAAELLFRPQRVTRSAGRLLCADLTVIDMLNETGGFGVLGRLLVQAGAPMNTVDMQVLGSQNAQAYWQRADRHELLLDMTHETSTGNAGSDRKEVSTSPGLVAFARVLERWVHHFLGTCVKITPMQRIEDASWRWHVGLDVESMGLLNDLYEDKPVGDARMARLVSLFRLDFEDPADVTAAVAGYPVYLAIASAEDGVLKVKPQNLLLNLPLRRPT